MAVAVVAATRAVVAGAARIAARRGAWTRRGGPVAVEPVRRRSSVAAPSFDRVAGEDFAALSAAGLPRGGGALAAPAASALPARYKGNSFDAAACESACRALAGAVAAGNHHQVEGLVVALRLMMPAASGSERAFAPPRDDFVLRPEALPWSNQDFLDGLEENTRIVQECEAEFARRMAASDEGFRAPELLAAGLDLAVVYLKNYALDKADSLYAAMEAHCMARGLPWDVKFMQDLATLRCKQNRQAEAAPLLEEVAKRTPPHEATLRNLGTVYNMLREHDKARVYFEAAAALVGGQGKEDHWNLGIVHMHKGEYDEAAPLLEMALAGFMRDEPDDDVTLAKLRDSLGMCYDDMGRPADAVPHLEEARLLYERSIGTESPLYGTACERLARALVHSGRKAEGLDRAVEAFRVQAMQDSVHPTPLFELLGLILEDIVMGSEASSSSSSDDGFEGDVGDASPAAAFWSQWNAGLARLEEPIAAAVRNMHFRVLDQDANAGVLFERMARALLLCSAVPGLPGGPAAVAGGAAAAARRRAMARALLRHAAPFVDAATRDGLADLSHISTLISVQMHTLEAQDAKCVFARQAAAAAAIGAGAGTGTGARAPQSLR
eukprot:TRINITY_DN2980_c0_g1_i1.p1 TRINITY_DN2980_c0_g1~~TRINITY_DN2980_c0_g1_i1.p1  ORF type:complete len:610 (+),score=177.43 TRINITY_DN2980_c0_g1_i1:110-1939(+)